MEADNWFLIVQTHLSSLRNHCLTFSFCPFCRAHFATLTVSSHPRQYRPPSSLQCQIPSLACLLLSKTLTSFTSYFPKMSSHFLSNSPSTPTTKASDRQNDTSVSLPSTSTSSSISPDMWNYLWIPFLISLSKELTLARSATATTSPSILLPSQLADDSPSAPRCPAPDTNLNYRPVIGILSHPGDGASGRLNNATNASYIAASYVKFVESAGARVIPLIYNEPREILFEVSRFFKEKCKD